MTTRLLIGTLLILSLSTRGSASGDESTKQPDSQVRGNDTPDAELAADLKMLQGSWELLHGNEGKGPPSLRSVKTIEGNKEILRRYKVMTGEKVHEHGVEFYLSKSGDIRVFTFLTPGAPKGTGLSFVYKVDEKHFYDIPGLLHGNNFRNYQQDPTVWRWRRIKTEEDPSRSPPAKAESRNASER